MRQVVVDIVLFALPVSLAGIVHAVVMEGHLLERLSHVPLDFGLRVRGEPMFGPNKTLRGALVVILGVMAGVQLEALLLRGLPRLAGGSLSQVVASSPVLWGLSIGVGWVLGELANSFVKRRLHIASGKMPAVARPLFWTVDQVDGLIGAVVVGSALWIPTGPELVCLAAITLILHPLGTRARRRFAAKRGGQAT